MAVTTRTLKNVRIILLLTAAISSSCLAGGNHWTPQPKFSVDNSNYIETLIFISGIAYALQHSDMELKKRGLENFYCVESSEQINSKQVIELLNNKISGDATADTTIQKKTKQLYTRFPCSN